MLLGLPLRAPRLCGMIFYIPVDLVRYGVLCSPELFLPLRLTLLLFLFLFLLLDQKNRAWVGTLGVGCFAYTA